MASKIGFENVGDGFKPSPTKEGIVLNVRFSGTLIRGLWLF